MVDKLVLVVLTDIHFHRFHHEVFDLDAELRNELIRDVKEVAAKAGQPFGVIVAGDVAFSGGKAEYAVAVTFLKELCRELSCPEENVWVIPGNHDIDRAKITESQTIQLIHREIRTAAPRYVDDRIQRYFSDPYARGALFAPLENFNEFARRFGCVTTLAKPFWEQSLPLNDGSSLVVRGINSTLVSDSEDDTGDRKLVVGRFQTQLLRKEGVAYMSLCHHPVDWLVDSDTVTDALDSLASIQIFGHKHRQRVTPIGDRSLRISAGAVQPSRGESEWLPGFNVLALNVTGTLDQRILNVELWPRIWSDAHRRFLQEPNPEGNPSLTFHIKLEPWNGPPAVARSVLTGTSSLTPLEGPDATITGSIIATEPQSPAVEDQEGNEMSSASPDVVVNPERRLMYRFFGLSYPQVMKVAAALDLLSEEDIGVKDTERYQRFYARAKERNQLAELWELVEARYGDRKDQPNPFAGSSGVLHS